MAVCKICGAAVAVSDKSCSACGNPVGQAPTLLHKGELFDGKYEVLDFLGAGGMGELYTVKHIHLLDTRCIKIMRPNISQSDADNKRFIAEARIATRIQHPNVAVLYDFCQLPGGNFYMVWEYIPGKDVSRVLQACGRMPLALAVRVMADALEGMDNVHKNGVVHRDISPENLMMFVNQFGELKIKIIDLGIAKSFSTEEHLTQTGMFMGKLKYCSPEQVGLLEEGEQIDGRTDIYSIGLVLYEMVEGKAPFQSTTPYGYIHKHITVAPSPVQVAELPGEVGRRFNEALMVALEKDRNRRYGSAREFREALLALDLPAPSEEAVKAYLGPSGLHPAHGPAPIRTVTGPARTPTPPAAPAPVVPTPPPQRAPTRPAERPTDSTLRMPTPATGTRSVPEELLETGATIMTPSRGTSGSLRAAALDEAMETGGTLLSSPRPRPPEDDADRTVPKIPTTPPAPLPAPPRVAAPPPSPPQAPLPPAAEASQAPTRQITPPSVPRPAPPAAPRAAAPPSVPAPAPKAPEPAPQPPAAPAPAPPPPAAPTPARPEPKPPREKAKRPPKPAPPPEPKPVSQEPVKKGPAPVAAPPAPVAAERKGFPKALIIAPLAVLLLVALVAVGVKARRSRPVPPAAAGGYLSLQVRPWGTVSSLKNEAGAEMTIKDPVTPLYATLPEGRYTAVVTVAETGRTLNLPFTIRPGEVTALAPAGPEPDYAPFLDRIR